jgi:hypothetical protein
MFFEVFEPTKHRKIPLKKTFFERAQGITKKSSKYFREGDSVYAVAIDRHTEKVARFARDKHLPNKYKKDVDIIDDTSIRSWATHAIVFYDEEALYEYLKALHKMHQKDADTLLGDMLFSFGYTEDMGWFV